MFAYGQVERPYGSGQSSKIYASISRPTSASSRVRFAIATQSWAASKEFLARESNVRNCH